jgi:hypothetical protein
MLPSNVIEFPIQKQISTPHIVSVEYKFEAVKTKKVEELNLSRLLVFVWKGYLL